MRRTAEPGLAIAAVLRHDEIRQVRSVSFEQLDVPPAGTREDGFGV